jgi:hypothetical protein
VAALVAEGVAQGEAEPVEGAGEPETPRAQAA